MYVHLSRLRFKEIVVLAALRVCKPLADQQSAVVLIARQESIREITIGVHCITVSIALVDQLQVIFFQVKVEHSQLLFHLSRVHF